MGANAREPSHHVVVLRNPPWSRGGGVDSMMTTYYRQADNLSGWLTNARDAAAKVREETQKKKKEKTEKYLKFLKDLQHRVAESSKEKRNNTSVKVPRSVVADNQSDITSNFKDSDNIVDFPKQLLIFAQRLNKWVSRTENGQGFLQAQLPRSSPLVAKQNDLGKRSECQPHAALAENDEAQIENEVRRKEEKPVLTNQSEGTSSPKPLVTVTAKPPLPEKLEQAMSEPGTPGHPLEGWSIPMACSTLEMREVDDFVALASPASSEKQSELSTKKLPPLVLPASAPARQETQTLSQKLSERRKVEADNVRLLSRPASSERTMKCGDRITSRSIRSDCAGDSLVDEKVRPQTCPGAEAPKKPPAARQLRRNDDDAGDYRSQKRRNGAATSCSTGVALLKEREEHENWGQGKQSFSDVWKFAMDAERRYASERARLLSDVKRRRLKQLQIEKEQKQAMLKERASTRQRVAVQSHLEMVEIAKARRAGAINRSRVLEKRRFADALRAVRRQKLQGYGLQIPPLCNCNHGEDPLNPIYIKRCQDQCKLKNNFPEYTAQLEKTLQCLLDEVSSYLAAKNTQSRRI
ncbi:hypothetical protein R1sor_012145 [Riccia sorocarpa]|uniref:Uncharacterized protein n=1 Tax=Riccia sorocarpa TaxID=122646 RepID=A0ABD3I6A6_9MARC